MIQVQTWQECRDEIAEIAERNPDGWYGRAVKCGGLNRVTDAAMLRRPEVDLRHWRGDIRVKLAVELAVEAYNEVLDAMKERLER